MDISNEVWKEIGHGYSVSNFGRVRKNVKKGIYYLLPTRKKGKYSYTYTLTNYRNDGKRYYIRVETLVKNHFDKLDFSPTSSYFKNMRDINENENKKIEKSSDYYQRKRNKNDLGEFTRSCPGPGYGIKCGKKITSYRCDACWSIKKEKEMEESESHQDYYEYLDYCNSPIDEHRYYKKEVIEIRK